MESVLSLNNVKFKWSKADSIIDINQFSFMKAQKYFIYGPSGSGKSTLLNLMTGFIKPDEGSVLLLSKNISNMSESELNKYRSKHMGFVFQSFNLIPYLTAIENIELPLYFLKQKPLIDIKLLADKLNLTTNLLQKTESLSHGEQQRVALIKALIVNPDILICDEPTSSLDHDIQNKFLEILFSDLCKKMTVVFVSHNMSLKDRFDYQLPIESFKYV